MFEQVQQDHDEWLRRMFPGPRPRHHGVLGAMEELSELIEAKGEDEVADAVGDLVLFLISWCNSNGVKMPEPRPYIVTSFYGDLNHHLGALARCQLKMEQGELFGVEPRYEGRNFKAEALVAIAGILHVLYLIAQRHDRELEPLVQTIMDRIKERTR